jgi:purine-binding chemotaxis protein CheW
MNRELHIVGFRVGRETYGVPITSLREIVRVPEITAVPDAPEHVEGVINLRGKIVSVFDLRKRVDSASDVLKIPVADVDPSPTEFVEGGLNCVTGLGKYQGRLIVLLDIEKVLEFSGTRLKDEPTKNAGSPAVRDNARSAAASK